MNVDPLIAGPVIVAVIAMQGWILMQISGLKADVAALSARMEYLSGNPNQRQNHERHNSNSDA